MNKIFSLTLAFLIMFLSGMALNGNKAFADVQIDSGQEKSTTKRVFFIGRYARTNAIATNGNVISTDRVVVWDSVSDDGVTVNLSTTSYDALVAGVTLDEIPGSSRDNSAANDLGYNNWGRILVYGRHATVSWDQSTVDGGSFTVGSKVAVSTKLGGTAGIFAPNTSPDGTAAGYRSTAISYDSFGVLLDAPAAGDKTADIFVNRM